MWTRGRTCSVSVCGSNLVWSFSALQCTKFAVSLALSPRIATFRNFFCYCYYYYTEVFRGIELHSFSGVLAERALSYIVVVVKCHGFFFFFPLFIHYVGVKASVSLLLPSTFLISSRDVLVLFGNYCVSSFAFRWFRSTKNCLLFFFSFFTCLRRIVFCENDLGRAFYCQHQRIETRDVKLNVMDEPHFRPASRDQSSLQKKWQRNRHHHC